MVIPIVVRIGNSIATELSDEGFEPINQWPSCYYHSKLRVSLAVYVDDFKMSGPKAAMETAWGLIRKDLVLEDPTDIGLLPCLSSREN